LAPRLLTAAPTRHSAPAITRLPAASAAGCFWMVYLTGPTASGKGVFSKRKVTQTPRAISTSIPSSLNVRVKLFQFYSGVLGFELPVDAPLSLIPVDSPSHRTAGHFCLVGDAISQRLPRQDAQFRFRHVQPAPMFGGMNYLQFPRQPHRFLRLKGLIQGTQVMRIEVVADQGNHFSLPITRMVHQAPHLFCPIPHRPPCRHLNVTPAG